MKHIIAIANQKGGLEKQLRRSTLPHRLLRPNAKVLLIDLDPQR